MAGVLNHAKLPNHSHSTRSDPIGILVRESERPTNRENNHKRRGREVGDLGSGGHKSMQQKQ